MTSEERLRAEAATTSLLAGVFGAATVAAVSSVGTSTRRRYLWRWGAVLGAASGLFAGRHRLYDWRTGRGRLAFVIDHTWALATSGAGVLVALANMVLGSPIDHSLSTRQNRVVFERGVTVRPGFALSMGYVVSGAADREGRMTPRRRRLVTDHEDVHIWQARRWGPLYPVLYGTWFVCGAVVGVARWWKSDRQSMTAHVDAAAYYCNPFEWRAYSEDRNWPPAGVDPALVWERPYSPSSVTGTLKELRGSRGGRR